MGATNEAAEILQEALSDPGGTNMPDLMARLVQANYNEYAAVTSRVIEGYQKRISDLEAELGAIRRGINHLFQGDYMPTQTAIEMAVFYPPKALVEQCRPPKENG